MLLHMWYTTSHSESDGCCSNPSNMVHLVAIMWNPQAVKCKKVLVYGLAPPPGQHCTRATSCRALESDIDDPCAHTLIYIGFDSRRGHCRTLAATRARARGRAISLPTCTLCRAQQRKPSGAGRVCFLDPRTLVQTLVPG